MSPKRKREPETATKLLDLTAALEYKLLRVIQDGKGGNPNVYLVQVRRLVDSKRSAMATCILKAVLSISLHFHCLLYSNLLELPTQFPTNSRNQEFFQNEVAANLALIECCAPKTVAEACDALFTILAKSPAERWPRLLGGIRTPESLLEGQWMSAAKRPTAQLVFKGLLLEYMPDLVPFTADMVDDVLADDFLQILQDLHAHGVVHWDHVDHCAWPEIGFGNVFVRYNDKLKRRGQSDCSTSQLLLCSGCIYLLMSGVIILDFNRARIVGDNPRCVALKRQELERMEDLLARAMAGKLAIDYVPREVKMLL
jgi:hypothetical protein